MFRSIGSRFPGTAVSPHKNIHASGFAKEFVMTNTEKTAVEIEWILETPVREDVYEYIVRG